MPEKTFTVATYAAGASLAAITLIYVFGPTYFLDSDASAGSAGFLSSRKKGVVGLSNPANDCFINSVLQALAGLGDLRLYLIREMHRRGLDDALVYARAVPAEAWADKGPRATGRKKLPDWKVEGLQSGIVTKGLKDILDALNERPIYKKIVTAGPFVKTLEVAFRQRISRQQQDAQEFLQVVAERLCDEYHAGRKARNYAKRSEGPAVVNETQPHGQLVGHEHAGVAVADNESVVETSSTLPPVQSNRTRALPGNDYDNDDDDDDDDDDEEGFPLEGKLESQIECLTCGFKPRPTASTFCTLTLNVPQTSSTSLSACFDGMFKTEYIEDFKCEKCRLVHAVTVLEAEAAKLTSESAGVKARDALARLQTAILTDPEHPPQDVVLPDVRYAPRRRIARHIRLTSFPKIMAIHLSRSIYDVSNLSQKNSAKVAFPEQLPLGGLLNQRMYKLLGLVTHKGSHHSGHYESFRRQNVYPPFSNPSTFQASGVYSRTASPASTPQIGALQQDLEDASPLTSTPDLLSASASGNDSSTPSLDSAMPPASSKRLGPALIGQDKDGETSSLKSVAASARSTLSRLASRPASRSGSRNGTATSGSPSSSSTAAKAAATLQVDRPTPGAGPTSKPRRRKQHHDRWWRISDEKIKEASTRDVLGMQREVYLLFYELDRSVP